MSQVNFQIYGVHVFENCSNLKKVAFNGSNDGLDTKIPAGIFKDANNIEEVIIPASVKSIETDAFYGCPSEVKVTFKGTQEQWNTLKSNTETGNDSIKNATPIFK